jgi:hypothetical protein
MPPESVFRVNWDYMKTEPAAVVAGLVEFLGLEPEAAQSEAAAGHIRGGVAA